MKIYKALLLQSTTQASDNLFLQPPESNVLGQKTVRKLH